MLMLPNKEKNWVKISQFAHLEFCEEKEAKKRLENCEGKSTACEIEFI